MNPFKTKATPWWELGLVKFSALCFGLAVGATWPDLFAPYKLALLLASVVAGLSVAYWWFKK